MGPRAGDHGPWLGVTQACRSDACEFGLDTVLATAQPLSCHVVIAQGSCRSNSALTQSAMRCLPTTRQAESLRADLLPTQPTGHARLRSGHTPSARRLDPK